MRSDDSWVHPRSRRRHWNDGKCKGNNGWPYPICSMVLEYLPTFAVKNHPNVGKYTIHEHMGYHKSYFRACDLSEFTQVNLTWDFRHIIGKECYYAYYPLTFMPGGKMVISNVSPGWMNPDHGWGRLQLTSLPSWILKMPNSVLYRNPLENSTHTIFQASPWAAQIFNSTFVGGSSIVFNFFLLFFQNHYIRSFTLWFLSLT